MINLRLPYVNLPNEFVTLLKSNLVVSESPAPIFDVIRPNRALYSILDKAFSEFNDGRGLEKVMLALGWPNFRERMASVYVFKATYGRFPSRTDMALVEDLKNLEGRFVDQTVHSYSRLFLLGFYLKFANFSTKALSGIMGTLAVPAELDAIIKLSPARSERIDWLILMTWHMTEALGHSVFVNALSSGKTFDRIYDMMDSDSKAFMNQNLLAYSASIQDSETYLYEKV